MPRSLICADDVEILLHQPRRQAERRLVDQQQFRRAHQAAPDRHHRLLAARHGAGKLRAALRQARKNAEDVGHARLRDRVRSLLIGADAQILLDGKLGKHLAAFGNAGDAGRDNLVRRQAA